MVEVKSLIDTTRCTLCKKCVSICPSLALSVSCHTACAKCMKYCSTFDVPCTPEYIAINQKHCTACGACIETCPTQAISLKAD